VISVLEPSRHRQCHWLLPCGGYPQAIAALIGAPLCSTGQPARSWREWLAVLAPLPPFSTGAPEAAPRPDPLYRYLLHLPASDRGTIRVSCWRRYPEGVGWQRRCGPVPLDTFVNRFRLDAVNDGGNAPRNTEPVHLN
jgi:hypothetical protein